MAKPGLAELVSLCVPGVEDPVGVQQQGVARLEAHLHQVELVRCGPRAEAEWGRWTSGDSGKTTGPPDVQRRRVARTDPLHAARGDVQLEERRGDEGITAGVVRDDGINFA